MLQVAVAESFWLQLYIRKHNFSIDIKSVFKIAQTLENANDRVYRLSSTIAILSII